MVYESQKRAGERSQKGMKGWYTGVVGEGKQC